MGATTALIAVGLLLGKRRYDALDRAYLASLFEPLAATAEVTTAPAGPEILVRVTDETWGRGGRGAEGDRPLIPDHGKLMHMFLVRDDLGAFAHLHPSSTDSTSFSATLPPLSPGAYRIYADIVHESGFAQTLVDSLRVPEAGSSATASQDGWIRSDGDDSWADLPPGPRGSDAFTLPSGRRVTWSSGRDARVDEDVSLQFGVSEPDGAASALEPYMGMLSHAAVTTVDGGRVSTAPALPVPRAPAV
jgi:hypothetical protein